MDDQIKKEYLINMAVNIFKITHSQAELRFSALVKSGILSKNKNLDTEETITYIAMQIPQLKIWDKILLKLKKLLTSI